MTRIVDCADADGTEQPAFGVRDMCDQNKWILIKRAERLLNRSECRMCVYVCVWLYLRVLLFYFTRLDAGHT